MGFITQLPLGNSIKERLGDSLFVFLHEQGFGSHDHPAVFSGSTIKAGIFVDQLIEAHWRDLLKSKGNVDYAHLVVWGDESQRRGIIDFFAVQEKGRKFRMTRRRFSNGLGEDYELKPFDELSADIAALPSGLEDDIQTLIKDQEAQRKHLKSIDKYRVAAKRLRRVPCNEVPMAEYW